MQDWRETFKAIRRGSPLFLLCFVLIAAVVISQQPYRWNITRKSGTTVSYSDETTTTTVLSSETQTETAEARPETEKSLEDDGEASIPHLFLPIYCQDLRELNTAYHESNGFYYRILHAYEEFFILPFQALSLMGSDWPSSVYPDDFEEYDAILFYQTGQNQVYDLSAFSYWNETYTIQVTNAVEDAPYAAAGGLFLFPKELQADRAEILFEENTFEFYYSTGRDMEQYACESSTAPSDEEMEALGFTRWNDTLYVKRVRTAAEYRTLLQTLPLETTHGALGHSVELTDRSLFSDQDLLVLLCRTAGYAQIELQTDWNWFSGVESKYTRYATDVQNISVQISDSPYGPERMQGILYSVPDAMPEAAQYQVESDYHGIFEDNEIAITPEEAVRIGKNALERRDLAWFQSIELQVENTAALLVRSYGESYWDYRPDLAPHRRVWYLTFCTYEAAGYCNMYIDATTGQVLQYRFATD